MFFRRKKKEEPHTGDVLLAQGIYLKQPVMENGNIILNCFLRCLIVFFLVFGAIGGFLSAFGISYNFLLVILCYLLLSMYFSFLYASSRLIYRDMGYILFFGIFVAAIFSLQVYANSGFYVIINAVLKHAQTFFDLSGVREYETQIDKDYLTVAIVAVFIGMVLIIILNIWIYSIMSLFWTVLLTFPLLLIPLYMKLTPDPLYIVLLGIGYIAVIVFKANGHYLAFAWDTPLRVKGKRKNQISYTQDAGIFKQILIMIALLGICIAILTEAVFPEKRFDTWFKSDRLREATADTVGNFVLLGFAGLYNRYTSTGGMSGGRLGGISNVRPDYQTDLIVSYTPYSNEAVYLKAYTGGEYGDNQWISVYGDPVVGAAVQTDDIAIFEEESMKKEADSLRERYMEGEEYSAYGRMDIQNVGADISYLYYPYYTLFEDYSIYNNHSIMASTQGLGIQQQASYYYYPQIKREDSMEKLLPRQIDRTQVDSVFLNVPEKNREVIDGECKRIGLTSDMTENGVVEAVRDYFEETIPYTLKPGATPRDEDFINYFLKKNRKGYCAHFASAATLIFRRMGIPARYVEGYAFSLETVLASEINEEKEVSDYYQGYSAIGDSPVMDVEVSDAMAHAWVEIYVDGFGWKVVEMTPGSNETTDEDNFWSAFTDFLNGPDLDGNLGDGGAGLGDLNLGKYVWLVYVVLGVVTVIILFRTGRIGIRKVGRYRRYHQEDEREALIARYADICDMLRVCDEGFNSYKSHMEQLEFIAGCYPVEFDRKEICKKLEKISYSNNFVSKEELEKLCILMQEIRKAIWKKAGVRKRLVLWKR